MRGLSTKELREKSWDFLNHALMRGMPYQRVRSSEARLYSYKLHETKNKRDELISLNSYGKEENKNQIINTRAY